MEIFLSQTLSLVFLLIISSFTYIISKKTRFPYTVLLVFVGLLLVPISEIPIFSFIDDFKLTPNILFFIFLPVLLFESGYNINYRQIILNWKSIGALAILGYLISAFLVSIFLFFLFLLIGFPIPYLVCLLFGSLISATDPVAVLSIFKNLGAPRRLSIILKGESLFNDGTAVALFLIVLGIIMEGGNFNDFIFFDGIGKFLSMLLGGILFGIFTGLLFSKIIGLIKNNEEVEIVLTIMLAHITFIFAEIITEFVPFLNISGVVSTVVASIVIGNYGKYKITPRVEIHMGKFWELFSFVSNSIVFMLIGLTLSEINYFIGIFIIPILITILVVSLVRIISVFIPIFIINKFKLEENIPSSWTKIMYWGSLRGALALIMALLIPGEGQPGFEKIVNFQNTIGWNYDFSIKDFILILTISCIIFALFFKATSISFLIKYLKVDKLHNLEEFEYQEGKVLANLKILEKLTSLRKKLYLTQIEYDELKDRYGERLKIAVDEIKKILGKKAEKNKLIKKVFSLHALGIEKQYLKELFYYNEIDEKNFKYILREISHKIEKIEYNKRQFKSISRIEYDYDVFSKFIMYFFKIRETKLDCYIRNRTRVIITRKVIKELRILKEIDFGFNNYIFDEIIEYYAYLNKVSDEKRIDIFKSNKATINAIESRLVNKSLLKSEEKIIKDLFAKDIITPKLYHKFMNEIEKEMYSDIKKFL